MKTRIALTTAAVMLLSAVLFVPVAHAAEGVRSDEKSADMGAFETFDRAKAKAAKEDKVVFVLFSTPACGWCKRLQAFMKSPAIAPLFEERFVAAKIDQVEMPRGAELRKKIAAGNDSAGVPWYAIVNADGKVLATATASESNIGFPISDGEIAHFVAMIEEAAPKISAEERDVVRIELEKLGVKLGRR